MKYIRGQRQSNNYHRARRRYAKQHLKVSRQRLEHAKRLARCVCASNDCIVYEDLKVKNLVRNHRLSKSITDAGWTQFRKWVEYFGWKFGKITIAIPPHYTFQGRTSRFLRESPASRDGRMSIHYFFPEYTGRKIIKFWQNVTLLSTKTVLESIRA